MSKQRPDEEKMTALETIARMMREDLGSLCQSQAITNAILRNDVEAKGGHVVVGIRCRAVKGMHQLLVLRDEDAADPSMLMMRAHDWAGSLRMGMCSKCVGCKR